MTPPSGTVEAVWALVEERAEALASQIEAQRATTRGRGRRRCIVPRGRRRRWRITYTVGCEEVMSPTWIWMQAAIVVFVLIGMVIAIVKLA